MSQKTSTRHAITHELSSVNRGGIQAWAQIGHLLDQADRSQSWRAEAKSFTEWLRHQSHLLGLTEASLWRYLSATRYYLQLRESLLGRNVPCPPLLSLPHRVSPDNLEILSRLERVVPIEVFEKMSGQVIAGSITRTELLACWKAYKPVLGGRTARGLGVTAPRFNPEDPEQRHHLAKAKALAALGSTDGSWTGIQDPDLYEMFMNITSRFSGASFPNFTFDAVILVKEGGDNTLQTHGVEIGDTQRIRWSRKMADKASYFDCFWVVLPEQKNVATPVPEIPGSIGILRSSDEGLYVQRPAQQPEPADGRILQMTRWLLLKALKR